MIYIEDQYMCNYNIILFYIIYSIIYRPQNPSQVNSGYKPKFDLVLMV